MKLTIIKPDSVRFIEAKDLRVRKHIEKVVSITRKISQDYYFIVEYPGASLWHPCDKKSFDEFEITNFATSNHILMVTNNLTVRFMDGEV